VAGFIGIIMKNIEVLSLFDGISCGQIALDQLGYTTNYLASEIDKFAESVSEKQYPHIVRLGNVIDVEPEGLHWNLLLGGSPCQSFSVAGKREGFDGKSNLFWEYDRVFKSGVFDYFLLENVKMKAEWRDVISEAVGVEPILLNSKNFSAQSRERYYWTNIPVDISSIRESPVLVEDILEESVDPKYYLSEQTLDRIYRSRTHGDRLKDNLKIKSATIIAGYGKLPSDGEYINDGKGYRKYTPVEFERLQGIPDNYTSSISDTRRYQCIGNAWNIPTIKFILRNI
jgi:site-specific DNA-cytosine methylase